MNILFISPHPWRNITFAKIAFSSLTLKQLAAITPECHDVETVDEKYQQIDFSKEYDIVGISCMTYNAPRGYEIADIFRRRGVTVVLGGYHPSALPEEAKQHADAVVIGEAELTWPRLLDDWKKRELKPFYRSDKLIDPHLIPPARHNIKSEKTIVESIQTSRGCPVGCEFCSIQNIEGIPEDVKRIFVTAHDISPEWHVRMQASFQKYVHNATSKTINFPHNATLEDVRKAYLLAYELGCKGITIYRDKSREEQVLNIGNKDPKQDQKIMVEAGKISPRPRPEVIIGTTTKVATGCGNLYVTINIDEEGKPFELFTQMGKAGGCAASQLEAIGRLVSLAFRSGIEVKSIIEQLRNIRCPSPSWEKGQRIFSCADAIARVVEKRLVNGQIQPVSLEATQVAMKHAYYDESITAIEDSGIHGEIVGVCPDCGGALQHEEGCIKCHGCGFSKC